MAENILLVEGDYDKEFIQRFCDSSLGVNAIKVQVLTPKGIGVAQNGWRSITDNLSIPLKKLAIGDIDKFGIMLDADYSPNNSGGFSSRYKLITAKLKLHDYVIPDQPNLGNGDIFKHNNGLAAIGLWIMPDHRNDGMIEAFIEKMIATNVDQQALLVHANKTVTTTLPVTLFNKAIHTTKSKVLTWLAWQKKPGQLHINLTNGVFDRNKVANFETWLKSTFL